MIVFFRAKGPVVYAVGTHKPIDNQAIQKLTWLFAGATPLPESNVTGFFTGPRKEMVTPWSTNAVEITQTMGINGIERIEEFFEGQGPKSPHDKMLQHVYESLTQDLFTIHHAAEPVLEITDIKSYSEKEGLALSAEEIEYLNHVSKELNRPLTDSEVFGFSQVNSEHCRHKIFNGTFIIDGVEKKFTLFQLIKKTSKENPNLIVSAYKDNVAFIKGPRIEQFAPKRQDVADYFEVKDFDSVLSLKAETHNFPTTVEPFNGAATGSGGEIRDRLAGGKGSLPLAGTAVYMTSYPRLEKGKTWEENIVARPWLYQTPTEILIKASDGASDFGNKFGQPLISGSILTFEHIENGKSFGYDKVIMQAGGVGFGKEKDSQKESLQAGDKIVLMGGDNYRIGMGGGAVSSVATGEFTNAIELNAIQRSNPEMQKRVMNAIRAMVELDNNPIVSIHDHGAGGHLNCFSELLEETGGQIEINKLPIGDPTLSAKEIISNESQERMGIAIHEKDLAFLKKVSERERAPIYSVGTATGDKKLSFDPPAPEGGAGARPLGALTPPSGAGGSAFGLSTHHLFGSSPKTILRDSILPSRFAKPVYDLKNIHQYIEQVLQLEAVACKDWLTNKVDRSVSGKVATQQTCGEIQLPLNNVSVMALDFLSHKGVATAIGHAPVAALVNPAAGSRLAIAEALTNLVWAPLTHGLKGVSLSANWMWPTKTEGENARLYQAVEAVSDFAIALGINIPTGKDSLSMTQKYPDGQTVDSPGTVIISAMAEVEDIRKTISPSLQLGLGSRIFYISFTKDDFNLGGSCLGQTLNVLGRSVPDVSDPAYFANCFAAIQELVKNDWLLAGHDVSSGGMITALLEMCFPTPGTGMKLDLFYFLQDTIEVLFSENPGVLLQVENEIEAAEILGRHEVEFVILGQTTTERTIEIIHQGKTVFDIEKLRDKWFHTSYLFDRIQRPKGHAEIRKQNIFKQPLSYQFQPRFDGKFSTYGIDPKRRKPSGIKAAIIREKGVNGDREMAYSLYLAGFDVKDVHMTDLVSGREDLSDVSMIVFVGGFSNSDVLGSAKGWAGAFLYNPKAKAALDNFYKRKNTLSLGVCNGCQLMMELGLVYPEKKNHPKMHHNDSGKFESTFVTITIPKTNSVMLQSFEGARLGAWVAHGEGRFQLTDYRDQVNVAAMFSYDEYPGNPNGSDFSVAALSSIDGRHLAIMPHIERSLFPWNWPYYPANEKQSHQVGPWIEAFSDARDWVTKKLVDI
jgi:phosphoribosylformylglycinamidine synthase